MQSILEIKNGVPRHPLYRMSEPVNLVIEKGEQLAIVGPNGSGKSLLVDIITGRWPMPEEAITYNFEGSDSRLISEQIKYIAFRDSYGDSDSSYYQQRWNAHDLEETPTVKELLPSTTSSPIREILYNLFNLKAFLDKHIITLSSGELRKFQLIRALLCNPKILIMDNPFIGLDESTRQLLHNLLKQLTEVTSLQIILVLSRIDDIPTFITHIIPVNQKVCGIKIAKKEYKLPIINKEQLPVYKRKQILNLPIHKYPHETDEIIRLNQVSIRYGNRIILKELDWRVSLGEKWALSGDNGAGKSTLLSLICADNPQSYACNITLFGKKRGSGESIWDIKHHIGYVSPEMHRSYKKNLPAIEIVASGLYDTIGLYKQMKNEDREVCLWWMDIFGISYLAERSFLQLSSGEQRLVLLARAFVKDPALLILDEPLHGLDLAHCRLVKEIINTFCERPNKTMIMITHYREELPECINQHLHLKRNN